jgi:choice-of-anchor B domain-containing protein
MRVTTTSALTALLLLVSSLSFSHDDLLGTRYVATDGVDEGDCDHAHEPCKSIAYAIRQTPDGGVVKVAEGSFSVGGLSVEELVAGKSGVMGGFTTADGYKQQDVERYLTTVYGSALSPPDRERLRSHGLLLIVDQVVTLAGFVGASQAGADVVPQAARQVAADCVQGFASAFPCRNVDLLAQVRLSELSSRPNSMSNLWGFVDLDDNREYAVVGVSNGTAIVDVTDPLNPREVGTVANNASIWHEVKVYQFFDAAANQHRAYAYVTTDQAPQSGLQVIELSGLPTSVALVNTIRDFQTSHTIGLSNVDYSSNLALPGRQPYLYIAGANINGGSFLIYDLSDPVNPRLATQAPAGTGYMHDSATMFITDNRTTQCDQGHNPCEVLIDFNESTVDLWDVSNKGAPVRLSVTGYPEARYTHSGWPSADQRFIFVHDELDELRIGGFNTHIYTMDIGDLRAPRLVTSYIGPSTTTDHNGYVKGNRYYVAHYRRGLVVFDITNPEQLVEVGNLDTFLAPAEDVAGTNGAWGVYPYLPSGNLLVSDIENGLFVLRDNTRNLGASAGRLGFVGGSVLVGESAGTLAITVRRSGGVQGPVSVDFTTGDGSAQAGNDYTATSGTLTWGPGDGADKHILVAITDDAAQEASEQFSLTLSNLTGSATLDGSAQLDITVNANDAPAPPSGGGGGGGGGAVGLSWLLMVLAAFGRGLRRRAGSTHAV